MEATIGSDYMPKRLSRPSEYAYEDGCRPLGKFAGVLSVTLLVYAIVSVLLALALSYTFVDARMLDEYAFEDATDEHRSGHVARRHGLLVFRPHRDMVPAGQGHVGNPPGLH